MSSKGVDKCHLLSTNIPKNFEGPEDMVKYGDFIIIAATNHLKLYEVRSLNPSQVLGNLFVLYPNDTIELLSLGDNYPNNSTHFRPFSLNIFGSQLYVLNEDYEGGKDQIEVFDIIQTKNGGLRLNFAYFITFEENFLGMLNNFVLLDKNEFFITSWLAYPDPTYGRADPRNIWTNIKKFFNLFFGIQKTYIYYCIGDPNKNASCIQIKNTEGVMNNGIVFDKPNKLVYLAKTMERKVTVFQYKEENKPENFLIPLRDIELPCLPDNLNYDTEKQRILAGCTGRGIDHIRLINYANENKGEINEEKELWYGLVSIEKNNGSFFENKLMVCEL